MDNMPLRSSVYPDPRGALSFQLASLDEVKCDCLFLLDANTLLTPFTTGSKSLKVIEDVYTTLKQQDSLFVPAQAMREFLNNRASKLTDIYEALRKKRDQATNFKLSYPLLAELPEYRRLKEKEDALVAYAEEISKVLSVIAAWRWDDPVSSMYQRVLSERVLSDDGLDYDYISKDAERRDQCHQPPGYKDASKGLNKEGDVIIWHEILLISKKRQKSVVFVSGDEKSDWWHRGGNEALYPRFELVEEFRRESKGKSFHIISLSQLLKMFSADRDVVNEVEHEERYAGLATTTPSELQNHVLKLRALALVKEIREYLYAERKASYALSNQRMAEVRNAQTEEEKNRIWNKFNELDMQPSLELMRAYDERYKVDAILLRDELLKRLPEVTMESHMQFQYEHPTNPLGVEAVVSDLELLAKRLRD